MVAANKGHLGVVEALLEGGADVNHHHKVSIIHIIIANVTCMTVVIQ